MMVSYCLLALKPRLDYFIEDQAITVGENVISFDVYEYNGGVILVAAKHGSAKSSVYKMQQPSREFIDYGQVILI